MTSEIRFIFEIITHINIVVRQKNSIFSRKITNLWPYNYFKHYFKPMKNKSKDHHFPTENFSQ